MRELLSNWNRVTEYHAYCSPLEHWGNVFAEALHASDPKHNNDHRIMSQMANRGELNDFYLPSLTLDD